jgi:Tfp pilus assembly protein PilF
MEPMQFSIRLRDFDLKLLPIDKDVLASDPDMLRQAVTGFFTEEFKKLGGRAEIATKGDELTVQWFPDNFAGREAIVGYSLKLLQQGAYNSVEPILKAILKQFPDDGLTCLNYGMMLSDQKRLDEAISCLTRATELGPTSADAWNALGLAFQRKGDSARAIEAFKKSIDLEPNNPYTLRNYGGVLGATQPAEALPMLEKAAELMPKDQAAVFDYALCLYKLDRLEEASPVFDRAIGIASFTEAAKLCREYQTKIAHRVMRDKVAGGIRMDAVFFILDALKTFKEISPQKAKTLTFEVTMLGRNGFDINSPDKKYQIRSLPGNYSGLHMVALMYVGIKRLSPELEPGIDLAKEYAAALELFEQDK